MAHYECNICGANPSQDCDSEAHAAHDARMAARREPVVPAMTESVSGDGVALEQEGSANDMQVGGSHYKAGGTFQHWDYVAEAGMNYYQGNASKYVTRAYKKNGRQDLEKAIHYMMKAIELQRAGRLDDPDDEQDPDRLMSFVVANDLTPQQGQIIWKIVLGEWYAAIDMTRALLVEVPDEGAEAQLVWEAPPAARHRLPG